MHLADSLRWDVVRLWAEIQTGLAAAAKKYGKAIVSVGADTWGVDYVLLNRQGEMLGQPYHYRDARTNGIMEKAFRKVPRSEIFAQTGLQFMQFNTLYQLMAANQNTPELLEQADCLLFMPDFIHWALVRVARGRVHQRHDDPVHAPGQAQLVAAPAEEARPTARTFSRKSFRPARTLGYLRPRSGRAHWPGPDQRRRPAHPRHRLRRGRRAHRQHRQAQLGLPQFRHLVADGRRGGQRPPCRRAPRS